MRNLAITISLAVLLAGCVRQADLDAWVGVPVSELDKQPTFLTMQLVRTTAADGTEIRNYVNAETFASCSGFANKYNEFVNCASGLRACNNIFYIKNGRVERYAPIGSGGARCFTDDTVRPGYLG
jgi:hypothetical protein